jgi:hypothetical protein
VRLERRRLGAVWLAALAGETPALQRRPADAKPIGICCSYGFGGGRVLPVGAPIPL